jgi:hypothetical protein
MNKPLSAAAVAIAVSLLVSPSLTAQGGGQTPPPAQAAQDTGSIGVKGGGVSVPGWTGQVDANEARRGLALKDAKLAPEGNDLHVTTGPATTYWNPANTASGDYTVKATFTEANYMGLNDHPHPYGIVIGGNDMGTGTQTFLYCAAYGDGTFIVRGFGPVAFALGGKPPTANAAVHKAAGKGSSVTQDIAVSVKGDSVSCSINGAVVATYPKSEVVAAGKLKSTDGIYGIRFAHNTDAIVSGFTVVK